MPTRFGVRRAFPELLKLGVDIGQTSVAKYMVRKRKPPSQTWRTFLDIRQLVSVDFFTVPTIRFQVLYVFPGASPRVLRDRDQIFGDDFTQQVRDLGIEQVLYAPRSPWQKAYVERVIGTIRRECLDHVIIFSETAPYRQVK